MLELWIFSVASSGGSAADDSEDDADNVGDDGGDDDNLYIIGRFCLSVTFLLIPALPPSPVQSCYDWIYI